MGKKTDEAFTTLVNAITEEMGAGPRAVMRSYEDCLEKIGSQLGLYGFNYHDLPEAVRMLVEEKAVLKNRLANTELEVGDLRNAIREATSRLVDNNGAIKAAAAELRSIDDALGMDPMMIKRTRAVRIRELYQSNRSLRDALDLAQQENKRLEEKSPAQSLEDLIRRIAKEAK